MAATVTHPSAVSVCPSMAVQIRMEMIIIIRIMDEHTEVSLSRTGRIIKIK